MLHIQKKEKIKPIVPKSGCGCNRTVYKNTEVKKEVKKEVKTKEVEVKKLVEKINKTKNKIKNPIYNTENKIF